MKIFQGPKGLGFVPDSTNGMRLLGQSKVDVINFPNEAAFRKKIPQTPSSDYVWVIGGTIEIHRSGKYQICTTSDDGSRMWLDGRQIVNSQSCSALLLLCDAEMLEFYIHFHRT